LRSVSVAARFARKQPLGLYARIGRVVYDYRVVDGYTQMFMRKALA
jgi:hypothetical protein